MRNATKKTLVDRLDAALKARGVDLKRSAVIELTAQAFGLPNSDMLAKAANDGDLDPPLATTATCDGAFSWLTDPVSGGVFAYQREKVQDDEGAMVLSPYGSLLRVPADVAAQPQPAKDPDGPWTVGTDDDNLVYQQVGVARDVVRLEWENGLDGMEGLERHGLERFSTLAYVDVELASVHSLEARGASLVDGRINLSFTKTVEYEDHYGATSAIADLQAIAWGAADALKASGCVLRWTDDPRFHNVELELHVPKDALADLKDAEELEDAVMVLLGSSAAYGVHSLRTFDA